MVVCALPFFHEEVAAGELQTFAETQPVPQLLTSGWVCEITAESCDLDVCLLVLGIIKQKAKTQFFTSWPFEI